MTRMDCVCNRNTKIIATYLSSKLGSIQDLFDGVPYPTDEYTSPRDFFLNEDEWTTFENFDRVFRRAKRLINEPNFYFNCGASTKEIEIILPPTYDLRLKKIRTVLKVEFHNDFNPNRDYIGDPYLRGIISSIPTIWGLPPATIEQPMNSYNPETLFNQEPDFTPYKLDVRIEGNIMTLKDPADGQRRIVGEMVLLEPEIINGKRVFLSKYSKLPKNYASSSWEKRQAMLITQNVQAGNRILLNAGEIFMAPYFILDITYDSVSILRRLSQVFKFRNIRSDSGQEMFETIDQLRRSNRAKNNAYLALEQTNIDLRYAKSMLDEHARELEHKIEDRTTELRKAQQELLQLNQDLEEKVKRQVVQLERYKELRRYLSPKLTDEILKGGSGIGTKPKRKMLTVVFTDIRGFSNLTDSLEPEELFHLLDKYLSEMTKIVHHHDGTLNKIMADGLLIFFGDPIQMEDHGERAVRMAIDMQKKVTKLKDEWREYGYELGVGIGINTAFMSVGNIGSQNAQGLYSHWKPGQCGGAS
ncbi:MAG: hypothetical protein JRJ51_25850 [Deltaproteobacteria bacterium]|nr:hypothetical protein [Deltaproteobacteria bacterium]